MEEVTSLWKEKQEKKSWKVAFQNLSPSLSSTSPGSGLLLHLAVLLSTFHLYCAFRDPHIFKSLSSTSWEKRSQALPEGPCFPQTSLVTATHSAEAPALFPNIAALAAQPDTQSQEVQA
jgi:hypothetical protein